MGRRRGDWRDCTKERAEDTLLYLRRSGVWGHVERLVVRLGVIGAEAGCGMERSRSRIGTTRGAKARGRLASWIVESAGEACRPAERAWEASWHSSFRPGSGSCVAVMDGSRCMSEDAMFSMGRGGRRHDVFEGWGLAWHGEAFRPVVAKLALER